MQQTMQRQLLQLGFDKKYFGLAAALLLLPALTGCGSGAVSSPVEAPIAIAPSVLDMSPDIPRTFIVTGGMPSYTMASSNNAVLPVAAITGSTFTLVAKAVLTDTPVDITVRDAAGTTPVALKVTVKPTVFSVLPSAAVTIAGPQGTVVGQDGTCPSPAAPAQVDYFIFGGAAPYTVVSPLPTFAQILRVGGGSFTVKVISCGRASFVVTDATGRALETSAVTGVIGDKGSANSATFSATPAVSLACGQGASIALTGSGSYVAVASPSASNIVYAAAGTLPATVSVGVRSGAVTSPVAITFTSGGVSATTIVTVTGIVAGSCP